MRRALHISPNAYKDIDDAPATKAIWMELSKDFDEYHILARSTDNRPHEYSQGKLHLFLVPGFWRPMTFFVTSYFGLNKLIKKYNYEIFICQCGIFGGYWAAHHSVDLPVLVEIHEIFYFSYLEGRDWESRILKPIIRYSYEHATAVRSLNEKMTERLRKDRIRNKNIFVVNNRVDMGIFHTNRSSWELHNPVRLITVGNFVDSKDHMNLFKAIIVLKNKHNIHLTVIGGGILEAEYRKFISDNDLDVELLGRINQDKIVKQLEKADIYVHSSWREGMPRVILEAMSMKLPVIATAAGFTEGTVHNNKNGLIVPVKDSKALADAISRMIEDDELRGKLATAAFKEIVEKYEWNRCFDNYRGLLRKTEEIYKIQKGNIKV